MRHLLQLFLSATLLFSVHTHAETSFKGTNYSGLYFCKGSNISVGDYEVIVTLKLNKVNSHGKFGVYDLISATENNISYQGQAIASANKLAITFKMSDSNKMDYSTGLGEFKKLDKQQWSFVNDYYEPDDTGGNYGHEVCSMKVSHDIRKLEKNNKRSLINTKH